MKKIEAIIKPFKLDEVRDALFEIGIGGMTVSEVEGIGRQHGHGELHRGGEYGSDLLPKVKLEIVLTDTQVSRCWPPSSARPRPGKIGDGKVFVIAVREAVRIRTEEKGAGAL
jgi:nitrogen regulatory protein PII